MDDLLKNTGLIDRVRATDYKEGSSKSLVYMPRLEDGDWSRFIPTHEWQRRNVNNKLGYDTMSCVTFSALNIVEMQIIYLIKNDLLPKESLQWLKDNGYIDKEGNPNFNDWFTAVMSNTTTDGNDKGSVWDSIRNHGLLPQNEGFQVNDFTTTQQYLTTKPTQAQKDKALKILDILDIRYEWINFGVVENWDLVEKHLKQAPLHIGTPTCSSWNTRPPKLVTDCGTIVSNHATSYIGMNRDQFHVDLDHYTPFVKHLEWNYCITYVLKGVVEPVSKTFTKDLYMGVVDDQVKMLQEYLNKNGFPVATSGAGSKGNETTYFGQLTKNALIKFQIANNIKPSQGYFGAITRKFIANSK